MPNLKSQWEFGDLFAQPTPQPPPPPPPAAAAPPRRVHTVNELSATVRRLLEQHVGRVWVSGRRTNVRSQARGTFFLDQRRRRAVELRFVSRRGAGHLTGICSATAWRVNLQGDSRFTKRAGNIS